MIKHIYIEANVEQEEKNKGKESSEKVFLLENAYLEDENGKLTIISRRSLNKSYEEFAKYVEGLLTDNFGDEPKRGADWEVYCRDKEKYPKGTATLNNLDEQVKSQKAEEAKAFAAKASAIAVEEIAKSAKQLKKEETYSNLQVTEEGKKINGKKVALGTGVAGLAIIATVAGCGALKNKSADNTDTNNTTVETEIDSSVDNTIQASVTQPVSLEGKDWEFYKNEAPDIAQKTDFYEELGDYLLNYNCSEEWETITLTDEQIDEINEIGNFKLVKGKDNQQSIALEPAELRAFMATFGDYSDEQLASIYHGETIDIEEEMLGKDANVDGALTYFIAYALNSKEQNFHFEDLKIFDENELEDIKYWSDQNREYINLIESGKTKEAEAKMRDIRKEFELYLRRTDNDSDGKAFNATVFNGVFLNESNIAGYTHDIIISADDNVTGEIVEFTVKNRQLFDEQFEAFVNNGYGSPCYENGNMVSGFDGEALIKAAGKSTDRYTYHRPTDLTSYVDKGAKSRIEKLNSANTYMENAENAAKAKIDGYEKEQIEDLIQKELVKVHKDAHYNEGIMFSQYSAFKQRFSEILANIKGSVKSTANSVKGLVGGYKKVISKTVVKTEKNTVEWEEDRTEEAKKELDAIEQDAKEGKTKIKVKDGKTGKEKETTAQDAVDAAYDHYADGTDKKGSDVEWDESWKTGNEDERKADELGKKYGEKRKQAEEEAAKDEKEKYTDDQGIVHHISGGDVTIDDEYADVILYDAPQAPQQTPVEEEGFTTEDPTADNPFFGYVLSEEEDVKTR